MNILESLKRLRRLQQSVQGVGSRTEKAVLLREATDVHDVLRIVYGPARLNATSVALKRLPPGDGGRSLEDFLTGRDRTVPASLSDEHRYLLGQCLDRNLHLGVGSERVMELLDAAAGGDLALALGLSFAETHVASHSRWLVSRKYDGVRCRAFVRPDGVVLKSRTGKVIPRMHHVQEAIAAMFGEQVILDGELVSLRAGQAEDFQRVMSMMSSLEKATASIHYKVFDVIRDPAQPLSQRLAAWPGDRDHVSLVRQVRYESAAQLEAILAANAAWEGLMVRADARYRGGRSADLLKYKHFMDAEFPVVRIETQRTTYPPTITEPTLLMSAAIIDVCGKEVGVGSGFTVAQRVRFAQSPHELLGAQLTVKYFGVTAAGSLRFPTVKSIHPATGREH